MIYEYLVAPCKGESAIAKAINDKGREGWEPFLLSFSGTDLAAGPNPSIGSLGREGQMEIVSKYCLILRRPVKQGKES